MAVTETGKKAMLYTFSAVLLLIVVFAALFFQTSYRTGEENKVVSIKTANLNAFVRGLDQDIERGLFIAGFRALLAADRFIRDSKSFLNDSRASLREAMVNGTISGNSAAMMSQSTVTEWLSRIKAEAIKMGILVNFSFNAIDINQTSPWKVRYDANVSYNVTDLANTATFSRGKLITTEVSILELKDPLYTIFTNGKIIRAISITPYESNYTPSLNTSNLKAHINGLFYTNSTGPSYLMRLEGNLSDSPAGIPAGIEGIVRLPDLQEQGLPVFERSSVDYLYFGNSSAPIFIINNTFEDWFRLDDMHLNKYQAASIAKPS